MSKQEDYNSLLTDLPVKHEESEAIYSRTWRVKHFSGLAHLSLLYVVNVMLAFAVIWAFHRVPKDPSLRVYSPANDYVEYETRVFLDDIFDISPYQGEPNAKNEQLWNDLYDNTAFLLIDPASAAKLPNKTVAVAGTGGKGLVTMELFHQLHCLNMLRKQLWPEHYPDNSLFDESGKRYKARTDHLDHCIDRLRQSIMCHSDTATLFWKWRPDLQKFKWNSTSTHTCRNFDKIRDWAVSLNVKAHQIAELDDSILTI